MKLTEQCAGCLWKRQLALTDNPQYLEEIKAIIDNRGEEDCAPYLIYQFNAVYESYFGKRPSYQKEKKQYNDLLLSMEELFRQRIEQSDDPLKTSFVFARIGNYIDFGALRQVDTKTFLSLFNDTVLSERDQSVYDSLLGQCQNGTSFLLIADNCGEIVLDKLFLEQLKQCYPNLKITVMVRGGEALNDATIEDAEYVNIHKVAKVISNGQPISGTVYDILSEEARMAVDQSDIIFAKGQGNYESLSGQGRHIFYSFLCKCDLFTEKFKVPKLTGLFLEEKY